VVLDLFDHRVRRVHGDARFQGQILKCGNGKRFNGAEMLRFLPAEVITRTTAQKEANRQGEREEEFHASACEKAKKGEKGRKRAEKGENGIETAENHEPGGFGGTGGAGAEGVGAAGAGIELPGASGTGRRDGRSESGSTGSSEPGVAAAPPGIAGSAGSVSGIGMKLSLPERMLGRWPRRWSSGARGPT
jgi:hypothetical protein